MYIIDLHYTAPLEAIENVLAGHREYLDKNFKLGHFVASGRKEPRTGGIILAKGPGPEELKEIIKEDPFVSLNLVTVTITEFTPTKFSPAFQEVL